MERKIALQDSILDHVSNEQNDLVLNFGSLLVLNTQEKLAPHPMARLTGRIRVRQAQCDKLPENGKIAGGHLHYRDCSIHHLPLDLTLEGSISLFLQQDDVSHQILGSGIQIEVEK